MGEKELSTVQLGATSGGFNARNDYLLFGLLVRHGLCEPGDFEALVHAQVTEYGGRPLLDILAEINRLPPRTKADIEELLRILATPKLRDLLPQELPELRTLVETTRARIGEAKTRPVVPTTPPPVISDAVTMRDDATVPADLDTIGLDYQTQTHLTDAEITRVRHARGKSPLIGSVLAGHIVIDRLGAGGQGEVYLAKQLSLNRYVALKRLDVPNTRSASEFVELFRREAQILARINHSRIVKVHEIFQQDGQAFFTMEYLQGKTLRDLVQDTGGPLQPDVVANIACQACSALGRTAADGLIHRDIKPANMMLDENGDLKIVDFGLAGAAASFAEGTEGFSGTPQFASPEQFANKPLTAASDQYALGLTLYYALTGRSAWKSQKLSDLIHEQESVTPTPPSQINTELPRAADRVVLRMLEKDPARRFRDFDECYSEWEKVLSAATRRTTMAAAQLLGDALLRLGREQRRRLWRNASLLVGGWLLVVLGTILGEYRLRNDGMGHVLDACGLYGTWLLAFSLSCIFYVAAARRGWLPVVGSLRGWLYTHIVTVVPAVVMLMVHSGNFLQGLAPGPPMARPVLSILMSLALVVTAASGGVGLLLFRTLRRQLELQQLELRQGGPGHSREQMVAVLGARILSGWRLVHYPLAIFFMLLSIMHIALMLRLRM